MVNGKRKVVFITGAASGIGYATGVHFLESGYNVVFSDRNQEGLNQVSSTLANYNEQFAVIACDVTNEIEIKQSIQFTMEKYRHIDIVINNAGMHHVDVVEDFPTDTFDDMMRDMITGLFMIANQ